MSSATGSRPDGRGPVGNDLITVLRGAPNPVLAHLFMNYMLNLDNVLTNISFNGYMQPRPAADQRVREQGAEPPAPGQPAGRLAGRNWG